LSEDEFKNVLQAVERQLTRFPSTATVAIQQGQFLAKVFNKIQPDEEEEDNKADDKKDDKKEDDKKEDDKEEDDGDKPVFRYKHVGGYEYVGAEDGFVERGSRGTSIVTGPGAVWMWRSVYFRFAFVSPRPLVMPPEQPNPAMCPLTNHHSITANCWTSESDPRSGIITSITDSLAILPPDCKLGMASPSRAEEQNTKDGKILLYCYTCLLFQEDLTLYLNSNMHHILLGLGFHSKIVTRGKITRASLWRELSGWSHLPRWLSSP
jgi:hypothetical protein